MSACDDLNDTGDLREYYRMCLDEIDVFDREFMAMLDHYLDYCDQQALLPDVIGLEQAKRIHAEIRGLACKFRDILEGGGVQITTREHDALFSIYRAAVNLRSSAVRMLSWCSPAYAQSTRPYFFHVPDRRQTGLEFNYERSRGVRVAHLEANIASIFNLDKFPVSILATSSGMAALTLIENYLMNDVFSGDVHLYSPRQDYGEAQVLFRSSRVRHDKFHDHTEDQIIDYVLHKRPDIIFLSSLYNLPDLPVFDVVSVLKRISALKLDRDIHVVVDDTLCPGAINPFIVSDPHLKIYYTFSGVKYLQAGMDSQYAGFVIFPDALFDHLRRLRGMLGLILHDAPAWGYPLLSREMYLNRMCRISHNALVFAQELQSLVQDYPQVVVGHPRLSGRSDLDMVARMPFIGGLVTVYFSDGPQQADLWNLQPLLALIGDMVSRAREQGLSIVHSESFGVHGFRINGYSWYDAKPPYLRMSCGDGPVEDLRPIAPIIAAVLIEYMQSSGRSVP